MSLEACVIRSPQPGDVLGDRYRVIEIVGSGGMGVVYRAQNVVTEKYVALKWLHPRLASGTGGERLLREARAASLLKHPHIVDIYDLTKDTVSDTWVLIMELLQGETLRDYMRARQVRISSFIAQLLPAMDAVIAAHALGIVHRDLKPENIFLERIASASRIVPKVLDFGIAKLNTPDGLSLTATGATLGTPFYMSPEQYRGDKDIDARTDVYAFGAMLYEAITGRMPHIASSLPELALKVTTVDAPSVKSLCPKVPSTLARLVDWALARQREDRIPSLKLLHDELQLFAREHSFRGEMTIDNASIPLLALPAQTAETLAETQLGVGVRVYDLQQQDVTPPPAAKTHRQPRDAGNFNWLPWSLFALTLGGLLWSYMESPERKQHAAGQAVAVTPELAVLSLSAATAADSGDAPGVLCADSEPQPAPTVVQLPEPVPTAALAAEVTPQKQTKAKSTKAPKSSAPAANEPQSPEASKRSIPKLLAF
ncbi:MAG TPA: protein kinase [Polyangiales bacterium]|nr:protein kinase [Polyangiales bacterium]